jgi:copper(I)-binding protein
LVNGMETMRPAGEKTIAPGGTLSIVPGGLHLMLMQPKRELRVGDRVRFRLHFADGSVAETAALVSDMAPSAPQ